MNQQGQVANVDLWISLLNLVDQSTLTLQWVYLVTQ